MKFHVIGPFNWQDQLVEPGAIVEIAEDDPQIALLKMAGKIAPAPDDAPVGPAPPPTGGDGGPGAGEAAAYSGAEATAPIGSSESGPPPPRRVPRG